MDQEVSKIRIGLILLVLILMAGFLFLFSSNRTSQDELRESFVEIHSKIADGGLNKYRQTINEKYGHLFRDCDEKADYNSFIDADSRDMSISELNKALLLHPKCGHYLSATSQFIINMLERDIEELNSLSKVFTSPKERKNATVVVSYWEEIYELEKERAVLFDRFVAIQEEYWKKDLDKALGTISSEEREAVVGALNFEANDKIAKTAELAELIEEARRQESIFWNESFGRSN